MPRLDLVIALLRAASQNDAEGIRASADAMANEEAHRGHGKAAERIRGALAPFDGAKLANSASDIPPGLLAELPATSGVQELDLDDRARLGLERLITEQRSVKKLSAKGLTPRHKVLLSGPPGNGKTSVAAALAHDLKIAFNVVSYGSLIGSLLGETNRRVESLFAQARSRPCVLFFDEFEAIGKERADRQETGEMKRALASLLTQIDALPPHVIVVAATNHPEMLDRAVWRRFELKLVLSPPNYSRTIGFLVHQLRLEASLDLIKTLGQCFSETSYAELKDFALDVRRRAAIDSIDTEQALRLEIEIRFPEVDWPLDDRSNQTPAQIRPPKAGRKTSGKKTSSSWKHDV